MLFHYPRGSLNFCFYVFNEKQPIIWYHLGAFHAIFQAFQTCGSQQVHVVCLRSLLKSVSLHRRHPTCATAQVFVNWVPIWWFGFHAKTDGIWWVYLIQVERWSFRIGYLNTSHFWQLIAILLSEFLDPSKSCGDFCFKQILSGWCSTFTLLENVHSWLTNAHHHHSLVMHILGKPPKLDASGVREG